MRYRTPAGVVWEAAPGGQTARVLVEHGATVVDQVDELPDGLVDELAATPPTDPGKRRRSPAKRAEPSTSDAG